MEQATKLEMVYEIKTYCPSVSIVILLLLSRKAVKELLVAIATEYINRHSKNQKNASSNT